MRTERLSQRQQKALNEGQAENSSNKQTATLNKAQTVALSNRATASLNKRQTVALSKQQIKILHEQLEAVYGINGYYVQELEEDAIQPPKSKATNIDANEKSTKNLASSNKSSAISEEIPENTVWNQIRNGLKEELGEAIDTVWFSKAVATKCNKTNTLTLTMPTRFMSDWVRNNYSHVIRRLSEGYGIKRVEYEQNK